MLSRNFTSCVCLCIARVSDPLPALRPVNFFFLMGGHLPVGRPVRPCSNFFFLVDQGASLPADKLFSLPTKVTAAAAWSPVWLLVNSPIRSTFFSEGAVDHSARIFFFRASAIPTFFFRRGEVDHPAAEFFFSDDRPAPTFFSDGGGRSPDHQFFFLGARPSPTHPPPHPPAHPSLPYTQSSFAHRMGMVFYVEMHTRT